MSVEEFSQFSELFVNRTIKPKDSNTVQSFACRRSMVVLYFSLLVPLWKHQPLKSYFISLKDFSRPGTVLYYAEKEEFSLYTSCNVECEWKIDPYRCYCYL